MVMIIIHTGPSRQLTIVIATIPVLFVIYMSLVEDVIIKLRMHHHQYSDDTQL